MQALAHMPFCAPLGPARTVLAKGNVKWKVVTEGGEFVEHFGAGNVGRGSLRSLVAEMSCFSSKPRFFWKHLGNRFLERTVVDRFPGTGPCSLWLTSSLLSWIRFEMGVVTLAPEYDWLCIPFVSRLLPCLRLFALEVKKLWIHLYDAYSWVS